MTVHTPESDEHIVAAVDTLTVRLDVIQEDLKYIKKELTEHRDARVQLAVAVNDLSTMKKQISDQVVSRREFAPVRNLLYGFVSVTGLGVLGALIRKVIS